jgi:hypothetical protein
VLGHVDYPVDIEGNLLAVRTPVLVSETVEEFAVMFGIEGVVAIGNILLECLVLPGRVCDLFKEGNLLAKCPARVGRELMSASSYPEVNIQISSTTEFSIANLEGNSHLVLLVELLVETLAPVGRELDVVAEHSL